MVDQINRWILVHSGFIGSLIYHDGSDLGSMILIRIIPKEWTLRYIWHSNALTGQLSLEYSLTILYLLGQKWMDTLWVMSEICQVKLILVKKWKASKKFTHYSNKQGCKLFKSGTWTSYISLCFQPSVRKTHNGGRKHKDNVRFYYTKWMEEQAQSLIDQTSM